MNSLLEQFWKWSNKTPEEYATHGMNQNKGEFEDNFPLFEDLLEYSKELVDNNTLDCFLIDDLITIMALDNESESVLDYIENNSSQEQLQKIIEQGVSHLYSNARWQISELLYRRKPKNFQSYLFKLSTDKNSYVRKRAQNCIESIKESADNPSDELINENSST